MTPGPPFSSPQGPVILATGPYSSFQPSTRGFFPQAQGHGLSSILGGSERGNRSQVKTLAPRNETGWWSTPGMNLERTPPSRCSESTPPAVPPCCAAHSSTQTHPALGSPWASTRAKGGGLQVRHHSPDMPAHLQLATGNLKPEKK